MVGFDGLFGGFEKLGFLFQRSEEYDKKLASPNNPKPLMKTLFGCPPNNFPFFFSVP